MPRTDSHRWSVADPAECVEAGYFDAHPEEGGGRYYEDVYTEHGAVIGDDFEGNMTKRGRCDHCGAGPLRYIEAFLHIPSGKTIHVGERCASRLGLPSRSALDHRAMLEQAHRERKVHQWVEGGEGRAELKAWLESVVYCEPEEFRAKFPACVGRTSSFLFDLLHKLNRYGDLSEKQTAAIEKIRQRNIDWLDESAEKDAGAEPFREGRRLVEGTVVSTKLQTSDYGDTWKMLVDEGDGNRLWGTIPSSLQCLGEGWEVVKKGQRVRFTATVQRKADEQHFGFYKRPTGAVVPEADLLTWKEAS